MKKIYASIIGLAIAGSGFAQNAAVATQKLRGGHTVALEAPVSTPSAAATGDTIGGYYWDFSDQNAWVLGNSSTPAADWEFTTAGPTGQYSSSYGILNSTTAANGWVMFDSDALGNGTYNAWIQLANSVDLTGYGSVAVTFQQLSARYQEATYLEVSTDGTNWTTYEVNANQAVNTASSSDGDIVSVNVSGVAANASTVWIRFRYEGAWDYAWQIDDVAIVEGANYDLGMSNVWHGDILNAFEYQEIPMAQAQEVVIGAACTNLGGQAMTNAVYTYDISDGSSSVASGTFPASNTSIDPTVTDTTWYSTGFTPSAVGQYTVTVSVSSDQSDENSSNDEKMSAFYVTDYVYGHDDIDNITVQISGGSDGNSSPNEFKAAMYYEVFADATLTAVQVAFGSNTSTSSCIVEVFDPANDQSLTNPLITEVYDIQAADISSGSSLVLVDIPLDGGNGVLLSAGGLYLISVGNTGPGESLTFLASDGDADRASLRYGPYGSGGAVDWYTGWSTSPIIRGNFDPTVGIQENEDVTGVQIYPNPVADNLTVRFEAKQDQDFTVRVLNVAGQMVLSSQSKTKAGQKITKNFNVENLAAGVYMVQIQGATASYTQRVIVQ
ncbi:MAG: T9SS type A sorting domain-containing protein [Flavobacteriales bacterium]|nr:T9SS type A sorting domain-containing protein [Flavobacteriales bacterium]